MTPDGPRYFDCGHRRLTYDGHLLPDVCEYIHIFEKRASNSHAWLRWRAVLMRLSTMSMRKTMRRKKKLRTTANGAPSHG